MGLKTPLFSGDMVRLARRESAAVHIRSHLFEKQVIFLKSCLRCVCSRPNKSLANQRLASSLLEQAPEVHIIAHHSARVLAWHGFNMVVK